MELCSRTACAPRRETQRAPQSSPAGAAKSCPKLPRTAQSCPELPLAAYTPRAQARGTKSSPELPRAVQISPELPGAPQSCPELSRIAHHNILFFSERKQNTHGKASFPVVLGAGPPPNHKFWVPGRCCENIIQGTLIFH